MFGIQKKGNRNSFSMGKTEDICSISPHLKKSEKKSLQTKFALQNCGYFRLDLYALPLLQVSQDAWKEKDSKKKS